MKKPRWFFLIATIVVVCTCLSVVKAQVTQPINIAGESNKLPHKRLFSGLGGSYCFMSGIPTNNIISVANTYQGFTTYGEEELTTSNTVWGFYIDLLEFYCNKRVSLNLSSFNGWSGTPHSEIADLVQSEKTFFIASALMVNYNFRVNYHSEGIPSYKYSYFGIGPTSIQAKDMEASVTLSDGTERMVSAAYSRVAGFALQIGTKTVGGSKGSAQINIAARLGIPFDKMSVDHLTVKENGVQITSNKKDMHTISPIYFMVFLNINIGWL